MSDAEGGECTDQLARRSWRALDDWRPVRPQPEGRDSGNRGSSRPSPLAWVSWMAHGHLFGDSQLLPGNLPSLKPLMCPLRPRSPPHAASSCRARCLGAGGVRSTDEGTCQPYYEHYTSLKRACLPRVIYRTQTSTKHSVCTPRTSIHPSRPNPARSIPQYEHRPALFRRMARSAS